MFAGNNEIASRGFIANNNGHMHMEMGFDGDFYVLAKKDKPKKNKNYQKRLKLDVDSELHFSVTVPVKINLDAAPMVEINLSGEVARKFINADIAEREKIIAEFFGDRDWRNEVDYFLMTDSVFQILKFFKRVEKLGKILNRPVPLITEYPDCFMMLWTPAIWFKVDFEGKAIFQKGFNKKNQPKREEFSLYWEDDWDEIILTKLMKIKEWDND